MKKTFLLFGTILLSLLIFIGMPYCLLKSSLMQDCTEPSATCAKSIQHKLSHKNSIYPNIRNFYIPEKVSISHPFE